MVVLYHGRGRPVGLKIFSLDSRRTQPFLARLCDGDGILDRSSIIENIVKLTLAHADDDRPGIIRGAEGNDMGIGLSGARGRGQAEQARANQRGGLKALVLTHRQLTPTGNVVIGRRSFKTAGKNFRNGRNGTTARAKSVRLVKLSLPRLD